MPNTYMPGTIVFYIDGSCAFCRWGSHLFRRILRLKDAAIVPSSFDPRIHRIMQEHNSWVLETAAGELHFGFDAITYAVSRSWLRWLTPLLRLSPVQWIGEHFYHLVTLSRPVLSKAGARDRLARLRL